MDRELQELIRQSYTDPEAAKKVVEIKNKLGQATTLLHAVWNEKIDGKNIYLHRVIHSSDDSYENVIRSFIKEHPEWESGDPYEWGCINGGIVSLSTFTVLNSLPYRYWENLRESERDYLINKQRKESEDKEIAFYKELKKKYG